ncbi:nucleotidyltransferase family protein [Caenimonas sedimenti]|uniref:Nucleotidyltransferase family protein n=1 Tax=Caenimonas sedimenti TaxID=2596921 RepID=A0A562ZPU7_9BURK|nr:nucleotidyltransferase family protein [Caenimonas sedimenti]TWO70612.1 nucleotidyltransferase family protein [Caenimonas sedimenti]
MDADRFTRAVLANRHNRAILERWDRLALPDGWLVAGCLFQTVWNLKGGAAAEAHIKDYDLFYFDGADLSEEGERQVQARVDEVLGDLGVAVEAKNQARVHLWYPEYFGHAYPPLGSARDGIDRFLVPATCVGIRPDSTGWEIYAPYGLALLDEGRLTRNPLTNHAALFQAKAHSYRARWPWLRIES